MTKASPSLSGICGLKHVDRNALRVAYSWLFLWLEAFFSKHVIPTPGHATFDASEKFETGFLLSLALERKQALSPSM